MGKKRQKFTSAFTTWESARKQRIDTPEREARVQEYVEQLKQRSKRHLRVMTSPTPIYDELMDEFFPVELEFELPAGYDRQIRMLARDKGIPVELMMQDIVADFAYKVIREHS